MGQGSMQHAQRIGEAPAAELSPLVHGAPISVRRATTFSLERAVRRFSS